VRRRWHYNRWTREFLHYRQIEDRLATILRRGVRLMTDKLDEIKTAVDGINTSLDALRTTIADETQQVADAIAELKSMHPNDERTQEILDSLGQAQARIGQAALDVQGIHVPEVPADEPPAEDPPADDTAAPQGDGDDGSSEGEQPTS